MTRENIVYTICGLALGLIIGSFLIGPHLAKSPLAGAPVPVEGGAPMQSAAAGPMQGDPNMMAQVRQQLDTLKQTLDRDPNNVQALTQLAGMYMEVGKYQQAIGYLERALKVLPDPAIRYDLIVCYRENGQLDRARAEFATLQKERPSDPEVQRLGQALATP